MNDYEKFNLLVQVAKLYYENDIGQKEISNRLKISRSYVSKLLIEARKSGIVKIYINDSLETENDIEQAIRSKFHLKKAIIVPSESQEAGKLLESVGSALSRYLYNIVEDDDIIGISWGITLQNVAQKLIKKSLAHGTVTQLYGGMPSINARAPISEIVTQFAQAFNFEPYFLMVPAIVDSTEIKETVIKDKSVAAALDLARKSRIAVYSIGSFGMNSSFVRAGFPIIDRYVHSYMPLVGYKGGMRLAELITNALMDRQDRDCAEEDFEMVM